MPFIKISWLLFEPFKQQITPSPNIYKNFITTVPQIFLLAISFYFSKEVHLKPDIQSLTFSKNWMNNLEVDVFWYR